MGGQRSGCRCSGCDRAYILSGATAHMLRTIADPNGADIGFGFAMANAGDVNGDGVDDWRWGAPGLSPSRFHCRCLDPPCPHADPSYGSRVRLSRQDRPVLPRSSLRKTSPGSGYPLPLSRRQRRLRSRSRRWHGAVPALRRLSGVYAFSGANRTLLWQVDEPAVNSWRRWTWISVDQ